MSNNNKNASSGYTLLISLSFVLTFIVVLLSAYIRLATYGLGCEDWPNCFGYIGLPEQYQAINSFTDAQVNKPHGVARSFHRVIASVLGLFVILILIQAWRHRREAGYQFGAAFWVFVITVFLSVLGYSTPSPWLPWVTMGNLLGGFAMLALLWWMMQRAAAHHVVITPAVNIRPWLWVGLAMLCLQILLGGWLSANYAGLACPGWLMCEGAQGVNLAALLDGLNPLRTLQIHSQGFVVIGEAMEAIHMTHRFFAIVCVISLLIVVIKIYQSTQVLRKQAIFLLAAVVIQTGLGFILVLGELPHYIATAHNVLAATMLLIMANLFHHTSREKLSN